MAWPCSLVPTARPAGRVGRVGAAEHDQQGHGRAVDPAQGGVVVPEQGRVDGYPRDAIRQLAGHAVGQQPAIGEPGQRDPVRIDRVVGGDVVQHGFDEANVIGSGEVIVRIDDLAAFVPGKVEAVWVSDQEAVHVGGGVEAGQGGHGLAGRGERMQDDDQGQRITGGSAGRNVDMIGAIASGVGEVVRDQRDVVSGGGRGRQRTQQERGQEADQGQGARHGVIPSVRTGGRRRSRPDGREGAAVRRAVRREGRLTIDGRRPARRPSSA